LTRNCPVSFVRFSCAASAENWHLIGLNKEASLLVNDGCTAWQLLISGPI
jgi:hypothetical protein